LRFDDTNPTKEDVEYVESIQSDVRWLGFDWQDKKFYASDYFEQLYQYAVQLIKDGKAYVDSLSAEETRAHRGTLTEAGKASPYRDRSVEENLDLFARMRAGEFAEGQHTLRAKIDMASPNINMRDPVMYRILKAEHHRTGNKWCIYPMYDYAHCVSDAIERITHSICTLEFEDHRPLYDWFLDQLRTPDHPQQIEFARLNLTYTMMSKRKLLQLVRDKHVRGWDDPRMPTIQGLRRRGYTPDSLRSFCERIGVAKRNSTVDVAMLEHEIREDLNKRAPRVMAVLRPLKVVVDNFPGEQLNSSRSWTLLTIPKTRAPAHARCRSHARSTSSATISWKTRRRSFSASHPDARCVCATPTSSNVSVQFPRKSAYMTICSPYLIPVLRKTLRLY
jgi:glutaminyl-tRNA synthetase